MPRLGRAAGVGDEKYREGVGFVSGIPIGTYSVEVGTACFAVPLRTIGDRSRSSRAWRLETHEAV